MTITKIQIIEALKALPTEEFANIDEVLNEIVAISKIEQGLQDMHTGKVLSEDEMDKQLNNGKAAINVSGQG